MQGRWLGAIGVIVALCLSGCATSGSRDQRLARYQPDVSARERMALAIPDSRERASVVDVTPVRLPDPPIHEPDPDPVDPEPRVERPPRTPVGTTVRVFEFGDRLNISLRGIPVPEDIPEAIDTEGKVTLPLIGRVEIVHMTSIEAEKKIEQIYKDEGIYPRINVILIPLVEGFYFIRGEVKREGRYPMQQEVTLLDVIFEAGGFTPFANRKKVQIIRDEQSFYYNSVRIEENDDTDPVIQSGDKIVVHKRWI
jgi:polysaccharide export outer membrane protein